MKKILFIYPSMIIGGSTTALLSFLNCLSPEKYEIELQLFRNEGPLMDAIPEHVKLLPPAEIYTGVEGRMIKLFKFVFGGHMFKSIAMGLTGNKKKLFSRGVACDFQAKKLSRKNPKEYDFAIGYLEGWSDRYLAFAVKAKKKYAWLHSTFGNITSEPREELSWMGAIDNIVFVTDACRDDFKQAMPTMAGKAMTVANITDSEIIRKKSRVVDASDEAYTRFTETNVFKIVTVCRLNVSVKGLDRIVNAAKELKQADKAFLWYIIGDGEDKVLLDDLIEQAGLADCLISIGKRMNPYPFIASADIMCMPSRYEGKPLTVTESLILGTPPVVTEYLSANEQIENGVDGIVVENEDEALLPILQSILNDRLLVDRMRGNIKPKEYGNCEIVGEIEEKLFYDV